MKNAALILKTIYDNLPMILTIIAIVAGIGIKVRNFLKQSKEDQKKQLQEQADKVVELVKESLLSIVSKAEKEWGSGTGTIKKSWVWEQLQAQQQKLTEYISEGLIDKDMVDDLIEAAVEELNAILKKNQKAAEAVKPPEERESGSGSSCASGAEDTDGIKRQEVKRNATCLHYIIRDLLHGDSSHHYAIADRRR